jgi:hypothetical protein
MRFSPLSTAFMLFGLCAISLTNLNQQQTQSVFEQNAPVATSSYISTMHLGFVSASFEFDESLDNDDFVAYDLASDASPRIRPGFNDRPDAQRKHDKLANEVRRDSKLKQAMDKHRSDAKQSQPRKRQTKRRGADKTRLPTRSHSAPPVMKRN